MLNSRLRLKVDDLKKYRGLLTCNPTSGWIRDRFLDYSFVDHEFIASMPKDNPFLLSDYLERLRLSLPVELIQAWVEGDWDSMSSEASIFPIEMIQTSMKRKASKSGPRSSFLLPNTSLSINVSLKLAQLTLMKGLSHRLLWWCINRAATSSQRCNIETFS